MSDLDLNALERRAFYTVEDGEPDSAYFKEFSPAGLRALIQRLREAEVTIAGFSLIYGEEQKISAARRDRIEVLERVREAAEALVAAGVGQTSERLSTLWQILDAALAAVEETDAGAR